MASVRGEEALAFLHNVVTADVEHLKPGEGALACTLDEKGRVLSELRVLVTHDDVLIDFDEAARDEVLGRLARIAPLQGVTIEPAETVATPVRGAALDGFGPLPLAEHAHIVRDDGAIAVRVEWGEPGYDVLATHGVVEPSSSEVARIEGGRPRFGVDVTAEMLVNETPYIGRAVSFTKGCYPGQETVARVYNLGQIRRRLAVLDVDRPLEPGTPLRAGELHPGVLTSVAGTVAMGVVRAEVKVGTVLGAGDGEARVRVLL